MASAAKKRAVDFGANRDESEDHSSEEDEDSNACVAGDSDDSDSSVDSEIDQEVVVEFEGHTIEPTHFDGIKKLLQQLFLKAHVNTSDLTDIIIQQNHLGSVIRQADVPEDSDEDDNQDEVFGFISMLNLTERKGVQCLEEVKDLIMSQCEKNSSSAIAKQMEKILNDTTKTVGLLLSERFINVPPQIALPLHRQLQDEMVEAQQTNKPSGKCHYYLMISKTCKEVTKSIPGGGGPAAASDLEEVLFIKAEDVRFANAEEVFFYEHAVMKFHYSVQEEADSCLSGRWSLMDIPMKPLRTVMLIPAEVFPDIMEKLKDNLAL